jgi:hypothetical protein
LDYLAHDGARPAPSRKLTVMDRFTRDKLWADGDAIRMERRRRRCLSRDRVNEAKANASVCGQCGAALRPMSPIVRVSVEKFVPAVKVLCFDLPDRIISDDVRSAWLVGWAATTAPNGSIGSFAAAKDVADPCALASNWPSGAG